MISLGSQKFDAGRARPDSEFARERTDELQSNADFGKFAQLRLQSAPTEFSRLTHPPGGA
jgi:hypothetical protein